MIEKIMAAADCFGQWYQKLLKSCFFLSAIAVILFQPSYFTQLPVLDKVYDVLQILAGLCIGICYLAEIVRKRRINPIVALVAVYYGILILSTLLNQGDMKGILLRSANFVIICMMLDLIAVYNPKGLISSLLIVLEAMVYLNLVTILIFPEGLYASDYFSAYWFLGYKNQMINVMLPAACFGMIRYHMETEGKLEKNWKAWIRAFILILTTVLSAVLVHSGASILITGAMLIFFLFQGCFVDKLFNFRNYLILNILLFFVIVIFRIQNLFAFLIEDILHKNLTLTGRTVIWDRTLELIGEKPILGHGVPFYEDRKLQYAIETKWINKAAGLHAHDRFLETLYRGGIVLLIHYLAILLTTNHYLMKFRKLKGAKIIAFTLFVYLTGMITEFYDFSPMFFGLMTLSCYCDRFESAGMKDAENGTEGSI